MRFLHGKRISFMMFSAILATVLCLGCDLLDQPKENVAKGEYLAGDFHQHTLYTDGSYPFADVMAQNDAYGLQWWANSEHGGRRNRDGNGNSWLDTSIYPDNPIIGEGREDGYMARWQSLRDFVYPDILTARETYPAKNVISGLEWNVPGHEHCSTAVYGYDNTAKLISEFEYRFDRSERDTSRDGEQTLVDGWGALAPSRSGQSDAVKAVEFMQDIHDFNLGDSWVVPAHIERAKSYTIADFRNWSNAGPDVAIGYEGAPGHQASGDRGFSRNADGGGTYGGSGWYSAEIGGLWDALLGEGRLWCNFASSDFHNHWSTDGSDFWPGEYQKNYTYIDENNDDKLQAVFDGVRSGNSWHVEGDLIDQLEFTAHGNGSEKAMMGQTLAVKAGTSVTLKIKVHDPSGTNHCPLNMDNPSLAQVGISQPLAKPVLDHIDLISGEVTGYVDPQDPEYNTAVNPSTTVAETFARSKTHEEKGYLTFVYKFKAENDCYFRLRGTNLPSGVPFETDAEGNPLADAQASDNLYDVLRDAGEFGADKLFPEYAEIASVARLDEVAEAYADLWFYSNPIFIDVE